MDKGYCEGDVCNRNGCTGVVHVHPVVNCACHINPPCSACTSPRGFCPVCGWEESDEPLTTADVKPYLYPAYTYKSRQQQLSELVPDKVRWLGSTHTHFSMIREGVYPEGLTAQQVADEVKGSFGGRMVHFGNGKFKFIAYTD